MTHGDDDTPWGEATPPTHTHTDVWPSPPRPHAGRVPHRAQERLTLGHSPDDTAHGGSRPPIPGRDVPRRAGGPTAGPGRLGPAGAPGRGGRSEGHSVSTAPASVACPRGGVPPAHLCHPQRARPARPPPSGTPGEGWRRGLNPARETGVLRPHGGGGGAPAWARARYLDNSVHATNKSGEKNALR